MTASTPQSLNSSTFNIEHQFQQYRNALTTLFWNLDFDHFCQTAGLNPSYRSSSEQFQQFQQCLRAMNQVDDNTWNQLIQIGLNPVSSTS